jgi:hypothetical protein
MLKDKFEWLPEHEIIFMHIKEIETSIPVFRYFDPKEPGSFGLGATLLQGTQPIFLCFAVALLRQRKTTNKLKRYVWRFFSLTNDFTLWRLRNIEEESDPKPLEYIFRKPICDVPKRLQRMLFLQKYFNFIQIFVLRNRGSQSSCQ